MLRVWEKRDTWIHHVGNETGCFKRKSVLFFSFFVVKCCYFKRLKLTKWWLHLSSHAVTKQGHFNYCYDRAMDIQVCCLHSQALIKLLLEKMKRKSGLHIWREVPFTRHKETGRRKTKQRTRDTNDTTFQSNWHKHATSSLKTQQGSQTDITHKVPLLFEWLLIFLYNKEDTLGQWLLG